jgi:DNA-binding transcriptional regulator YiaG
VLLLSLLSFSKTTPYTDAHTGRGNTDFHQSPQIDAIRNRIDLTTTGFAELMALITLHLTAW